MATTVPLNSRVRITDSLHPRQGLEGTVEGVSSSNFSLNPYQVFIMGEEYWLSPDQFEVIASEEPSLSFSIEDAATPRQNSGFNLNSEEEIENWEMKLELLSNIYEDIKDAATDIEDISDKIEEAREEIERVEDRIDSLQIDIREAHERQTEALNRLWNFLDEHGHAP